MRSTLYRLAFAAVRFVAVDAGRGRPGGIHGHSLRQNLPLYSQDPHRVSLQSLGRARDGSASMLSSRWGQSADRCPPGQQER